MEKVRVYELAKELNTNSKTLIEKLKAIKIDVKNHMSIIEQEELKSIYNYFGVNINKIKSDEPLKDETPPKKEEEKTIDNVKAENTKSKKEKGAPLIIRTQVREIRTDSTTGITTEIRTEIKGDSRREVRTNIVSSKQENANLDKTELFEFRNTEKRAKTHESKNDNMKFKHNDNGVNNYKDQADKKDILQAEENNIHMESKNEVKTADASPKIKEMGDIDIKVINEEKKVEIKEKLNSEVGSDVKTEIKTEEKTQDSVVQKFNENRTNLQAERKGEPFERGNNSQRQPYGQQGRPGQPNQRPTENRRNTQYGDNRRSENPNANRYDSQQRPPMEGQKDAQNRNFDRPNQGFNQNRPNQGFNQNRPNQGFNQNGPSQGFNQNRPNQGFNQNRPNQGFNQNRPNQGFNQNGPSQGFNQNRPNQGFNQNRPKERDFIGEQLREVSKDIPKHVTQEPQKQINRDAGLNKAKTKDNKKDSNKPVKVVGKQDKNLKFNEIKNIGQDHKVSDILNNDEILLDIYDNDKGGPRKPKKGAQLKGKRAYEMAQPEPVKHVFKAIIPETITVKDLAEKIKKQSAQVIKKLLVYGIIATLNQDIDYDTAATVAEEFGYTVEKEIVVSEEDVLFDETQDNEEELEARAPVVVVMGHVDHGKTSLLDAIRESNVMAKEAGGITQHIGASTVKINNKKITFLDTPGHEAFTAMRARGAQITDIAILVVAADDGVMPQTIEAINHAKAANISIIVAVNKIDKPGANPERVKQELMEHGLVSEEWGGETICVNVSAKLRTGIDNLLEMVLLAADILELKANPNKQAKGTIIEAKLDKGRGPVATVLVQRGTLKVGDTIVTGSTVGRIRAMTDDKGQKVKKARPSTPVEIIGMPDIPEAGEIFYVVKDERLAKQLAEKRKVKQREQTLRASSRVTLDDLYNQIQQGTLKDLNIIVKADVQGSVEAIKQSLEKQTNEEVRVKIIHGGVGAITESDVMLANVSNAIIIGFNVRPEATAKTVADRESVDIKLYRVIYEALDDITAAMKGMLEPKFKEVILGHAEIRQTFKASGIGTIAGCHVTDGKITRNSDVRLVRSGIVVFEGKIASLKRFKEDVKEVATGYECGLNIEKYNDIKEGDIIESFTEEKVEV